MNDFHSILTTKNLTRLLGPVGVKNGQTKKYFKSISF